MSSFHSSADTWIVSVEDDWRCQGNQSNLQIQPDAPRVEMFLCIYNSPALIAQDFCSCPSPLPPPPDLPSPWCVCRGEVSCHSSCLPEAVSVPSVPWVLQILPQLREELSEIIGHVTRNSLCSQRWAARVHPAVTAPQANILGKILLDAEIHKENMIKQQKSHRR